MGNTKKKKEIIPKWEKLYSRNETCQPLNCLADVKHDWSQPWTTDKNSDEYKDIVVRLRIHNCICLAQWIKLTIFYLLEQSYKAGLNNKKIQNTSSL